MNTASLHVRIKNELLCINNLLQVRTSMKVMARLGHMPMSPDGRPWLSTRRQYSPRLMASCRMPAATEQTTVGGAWVYLAFLTRSEPAENVIVGIYLCGSCSAMQGSPTPPAQACEDALAPHLLPFPAPPSKHATPASLGTNRTSRTLGGEDEGGRGAAGLQGVGYQVTWRVSGAPLVVKSKADAVPPVRSHQLTVRWRCASWL